jgi:hypothetical protein
VNQRAVGIAYGAVVLLIDAAVFKTTGTGAGETDEKNHRGVVLAGPLFMRWSRGSEKYGWLYWPEDSSAISVSSITFRSVASIRLQDPEIFWYRQEMFD